MQGAGAAIVLPLTLTLLSEATPPQGRGMALGIWSGVSGLGVAGWIGLLIWAARGDGRVQAEHEREAERKRGPDR